MPAVNYYLVLSTLARYGYLAAANHVRALLGLLPPAPPLIKALLPGTGAAAIHTDSTISVVIPAFNEGENIRSSIMSALAEANVEVIVADGGSRDSTCAAAASAGAHVLASPAGRAACMNEGARSASGDLLVFLHSDTVLPTGWATSVRDAVRRISEPAATHVNAPAAA